MLVYTNIQHTFRKQNNLSCNEYVLCDMVFFLSSLNGSKVPGWCYMTKEQIAEEIGLTKQGILKMIERLIQDDFLVKNEQTKYLQTSLKWQKVYYTDSKQSLPVDENVSKLSLPIVGKESLPEDGKESLPYNNTLNNNNSNNKNKPKPPVKLDIQERKKAFFNKIADFKKKNNGKYPNLLYEKFYTYWSEANELKGGSKMRFENAGDFFEIGKRLSTFWARVEDSERGLMWKKQEMTLPVPQQQLDFGNVLKTNIEQWK